MSKMSKGQTATVWGAVLVFGPLAWAVCFAVVGGIAALAGAPGPVYWVIGIVLAILVPLAVAGGAMDGIDKAKK